QQALLDILDQNGLQLVEDQQNHSYLINEKPAPIDYQDVELSSLIELFARQAHLNWISDPEVWSVVGVSNQIPKVTIHWQGMTPEQALRALLSNYNLQLIQDPSNNVARIAPRGTNAPPLITQVIHLEYTGPTNLFYSVTNVFGDKRSRAI